MPIHSMLAAIWESRMQPVRLTRLAGAALALSAVCAWAGDLEALNTQIDALDTSAAMTYGDPRPTPGLPMTVRERTAHDDRATVSSALPAGGAATGITITWSGYVSTGVVYKSESRR
jgi:hypothetical protein